MFLLCALVIFCTVSCKAGPESEKSVYEIELQWEGANDLDLHVINPVEAQIYFADPAADPKARFGLDGNSNCTPSASNRANESVVWFANEALEGEYQILVSYYEQCVISSYPPVYFKIQVWENGRQHIHTGSAVRERQMVWVTTFNYQHEINEQK